MSAPTGTTTVVVVQNQAPLKSKGVAYLLWFFFGIFGGHRFYIGKIGTGFLWFFTAGLFFIGNFIDLFTLSGQVDKVNAKAQQGTHVVTAQH